MRDTHNFGKATSQAGSIKHEFERKWEAAEDLRYTGIYIHTHTHTHTCIHISTHTHIYIYNNIIDF